MTGPDGREIRRNWIFVEVHTDAGVSGIGEATTEYHELAVVAQIESSFDRALSGWTRPRSSGSGSSATGISGGAAASSTQVL